MNINLKKVISSVAALAMSLSCFTAFAADFTDVEATASYKNAIDELVALEIVNGYEDGSFKPDNEITRAEVTKMVVAAMGDSFTAAAESSKGNSGFADVDAANHWASGYISIGVAQKFINGMGDGTFAPDANVTYAQIVKMLVAALGYDSAATIAGGYPNGHLQIGAQIGVTEGVSGLGANTVVTRAHVAQLISNAVKTPIVAVVGWEQNYITGEPIAKTAVQDGTDGEDYKTLLTENHDTFVVKGRVSATRSTGHPKPGEVTFSVEYADNFDGEKIAAGRDKTGYKNTAESITALIGNTAAEENLFTYADALIKINADEDYELLTIKPYGKNEIVELSADAYSTTSTTAEFKFAKSATTSKTNSYKIDTAKAKFYVNGVKVADNKEDAVAPAGADDPITADDLQAYIEKNEIGTVTLIDSPNESGASKDGKYDVIMVTMPKWAVVSETVVSGDTNRIYFDKFEVDEISGAVTTKKVGPNIIIDTTDDTKSYAFYKNGEEIAFEDIKAGDIALVTYDLSAVANSSNVVKIELCDAVVEGAVSGLRQDSVGNNVYTVNGEEYKLIDELDDLEVGVQYVLYLDAAGRVIDTVGLASAKNYAVIDRVSYSSGSDAYVARLVKADGTRSSVEIKATGVIKGAPTSKAHDLYDLVYLTALSDLNNDTNTDNGDITVANATALKPIAQRVFTYMVNSKGELYNVERITDAARVVNLEYSADSNKFVGTTISMSEATAVIDASAAYANIDISGGYTASQISVASIDTFVDGEKYEVVYAGEGNDDNYQFVIILSGNEGVKIGSSFAVFNSYGSKQYEDGSVRYTLNVFDETSKGEVVEYFYDEDQTTTPTFVRGEIIVLAFNADGTIDTDKVVSLTNAFGNSTYVDSDQVDYAEGNTIFSTFTAGKKADGTVGDPFYRHAGITKWDNSKRGDTNGFARVGFGAIVGKKGSKVTFVPNVTLNANNYYTVKDDTTAPGSEQTTDNDISKYALETASVQFSLADDVNVYVIDLSENTSIDSNRVSVGSTGSIAATPTVKNIKVYDSSNTEASVYSFENADFANYAYFKVVNDEITDIVVLNSKIN